MLIRYDNVQWTYLGPPRSAKGKEASSGVGYVTVQDDWIRVYERDDAEHPSHAVRLRNPPVLFQLRQSYDLKLYKLVFTRPPRSLPTVGDGPIRQDAASAPGASSVATLPLASRTGSAAVPPGQSQSEKSAGSADSTTKSQDKLTSPKRQLSEPVYAPSKRFKVELPEEPENRGAVVDRSEPAPASSNLADRAATAEKQGTVPNDGSARMAALSPPEPVAIRQKPSTRKRKSKRGEYQAVMDAWVKEWVNRVDTRAEREREVDGKTDPAARVFAVVNGRLRERIRFRPDLDATSPARQHIAAHKATVAVLNCLINEPFAPPPEQDRALRRVAYDPFETGKSGRLAPEIEDADELDSEDAGAQYFIRSLIFPNPATLLDFLALYETEYGDLCWVAATRRSLELSHAEDGPVALHYCGLTIRSTPGGRVEADLLGDGLSRCSNILKLARKLRSDAEEQAEELRDEDVKSEAWHSDVLVDVRRSSNPALEEAPKSDQSTNESGSYKDPSCFASLKLVVHDFSELRLEAVSATDANKPVIGDTEVALIACIKAASFNSADGGRLLCLDPEALEDFAALVRKAGATRADLDRRAPLDPPLANDAEVVQKLERALQDSIAYFRDHEQENAGTILDVDTEGGQRAYADILANMTALRTRLHGSGIRSFEFLFAKDITASALDGCETFASGETAARGPAAGYLIDRIVQAVDEASEGWRSLTPSADWWAVILKHLLRLLAIIFATRVLHLANPLLLVTLSGPVNFILRQGFLADILSADSDRLDSFMNAAELTTPELLDEIQSPSFSLPEMRDSLNDAWLRKSGTTAVVSYGPLGEDCCLQVVQLHPGFVKYNPLVQDEMIAVLAAVASKASLARDVLARHLVAVEGHVPVTKAARKQFFRAVRLEVEHRSLDSGVEEKLLAARELLAARYSALLSTRHSNAYSRRAKADPEGEEERRKDVATAFVANRTERPSFVGAPLAKADLARLTPFYVDGRLQPGSLPAAPVSASPRLEALQTLLLHYAECVLDGLDSGAPEIATGAVGSVVYCEWYLSAKEGVELARSAGRVASSVPRNWTDEAREAYRAMCRAREAVRRAEQGVEVRGEKTVEHALRLLREDRPAATGGTTGRQTRRDVYCLACEQCKRVFLDVHSNARVADHACGLNQLHRVPILFSSSLGLLLGLNLGKVGGEGLPEYQLVTARSLLPEELSSRLPFDPCLDPVIEIPTDSRRSLLVPLALDALLIAHYSRFALTPGDRVLSIGRNRNAWLSMTEVTLRHIVRGLLDGDSIAYDTCPACSATRAVHARCPQEQHPCGPSKTRILYDEVNRAYTHSGDSILVLGAESCRRLIYALTDSRDKLIVEFATGEDSHGNTVQDPVICGFIEETAYLSPLQRRRELAARIFGWRSA